MTKNELKEAMDLDSAEADYISRYVESSTEMQLSEYEYFEIASTVEEAVKNLENCTIF